MVIETSLRKSCENNELQLFYQPQVNLENGQTIGADA
jgi:EAL domain-containing protein (putative c-di-GMP-specific phosphodiesterase class I)